MKLRKPVVGQQPLWADTAPVRRPRRAPPVGSWATLPVLLVGTFLIVLDFFVVNVALPTIQADLGASAAAIEWVVAGYGLTFAVFQIGAGRVADHVGRRRVFAIGLALFALASAGCGLAPNPTVLVAARLVQGLAAALISPTVLAIVGVNYTGRAQTRAVSVYGMVMGFSAAGGQLIGGLLINADLAGLGWRVIFLINLPVVAIALALVPRLVPETRAQHRPGVDGTGILLLIAALTFVVLPLIEGRQQGWPAWTWASAALTVLAAAALLRHHRRTVRAGATPLLDPALFAVPAFRAGLLVQVAYWSTQAPFYLVIALYLQQGRGLDPLRAGLLFTILAAAYLGTSIAAPGLTQRHGRRLLAAGSVALAAGFGLLALGATGPWQSNLWALVPGLIISGVGMGLSITPLTMTVLAHADPHQAGIVSGALSTMQQVGNTIGVALTGVVFFGTLDEGYPRAFVLSLLQLIVLLLLAAGLTRLLPRARTARDPSRTGQGDESGR